MVTIGAIVDVHFPGFFAFWSYVKNRLKILVKCEVKLNDWVTVNVTEAEAHAQAGSSDFQDISARAWGTNRSTCYPGQIHRLQLTRGQDAMSMVYSLVVRLFSIVRDILQPNSN